MYDNLDADQYRRDLIDQGATAADADAAVADLEARR